MMMTRIPMTFKFPDSFFRAIDASTCGDSTRASKSGVERWLLSTDDIELLFCNFVPSQASNFLVRSKSALPMMRSLHDTLTHTGSTSASSKDSSPCVCRVSRQSNFSTS